MSLTVHLAALTESARVWDDQHQDLRGAARSLADVDTTPLGSRVQPAADRFIDTWLGELMRLETSAADHAQALRDVSVLFGHADSDAVERSRQLMTWTTRDLTPTGFDR